MHNRFSNKNININLVKNLLSKKKIKLTPIECKTSRFKFDLEDRVTIEIQN